jgi:hypothetical protein
MNNTPFGEAVLRSKKIRQLYHRLELKHHGSKWTTEEDALAFLTDAGLVGRLTMANQGRWPLSKEETHGLEHKLGECIWWLIVLADRMKIDAAEVLDTFLTTTEQQLKGSRPPMPSRLKRRKVTSTNA